jgi:hypothetical protein
LTGIAFRFSNVILEINEPQTEEEAMPDSARPVRRSNPRWPARRLPPGIRLARLA